VKCNRIAVVVSFSRLYRVACLTRTTQFTHLMGVCCSGESLSTDASQAHLARIRRYPSRNLSVKGVVSPGTATNADSTDGNTTTASNTSTPKWPAVDLPQTIARPCGPLTSPRWRRANKPGCQNPTCHAANVNGKLCAAHRRRNGAGCDPNEWCIAWCIFCDSCSDFYFNAALWGSSRASHCCGGSNCRPKRHEVADERSERRSTVAVLHCHRELRAIAHVDGASNRCGVAS
jgi:hypothetical protein